MIAHFAEVIERTNDGLFDCRNTFQMDHAYLMMRMQRWQGRIASATNRIWPCLSPFMFRSVLEAMLSVRTILRWRSLLIRKMLAKYSPQMAAQPLEHGFPAQPATWRNFYRFAPLATYFGKKAVAKVRRKQGLHRTIGADRKGPIPRLQLWSDERVKEALSPAKMKVTALLDPTKLNIFLENSRKESFDFDEQWARLLTLECALRSAASARKA